MVAREKGKLTVSGASGCYKRDRRAKLLSAQGCAHQRRVQTIPPSPGRQPGGQITPGVYVCEEHGSSKGEYPGAGLQR
jgi:hypothetical protein